MRWLTKFFDEQSRILFKNSSWVFCANLIRTVLVFLKAIILARGLGVELYGTYAIIIAFVATVQEFLNLNTGTTIIKFGADYKSENRTDKLVVLIKGGIIATVISGIVSILLVAVLLSFCYDIFIEQQGLEWFIVFYTIGASFSFFDYISNSVLRLYDKFKFNSIINIIMSFVDFLVILLAIYFYPGNLIMVFTAVIFAKFINSIICNGAAFWELRAEILPHFSLRMDLIKDQWKEIRDFTLANSGSRTLHTLIKSGDVLLLGGMAGPIAVGYYSVAKKLAFSILTLTDPLATSIYPQLAKLVSEERNAEIKTMLSRITKTTLVPGIAFLACVYLMQDWIITFLYGDQYIQAAAPFFYLSIHAVLGAVVFWLVYLLLSLNLVVVRFWITFTSGVIIFATGYLLIPQYGATGLAISLLISGIFGTVAGIYAVANEFKRSS